MAGGSFTISNGGVFGSMMGTPIINLPQTAVLGLHAIMDRPVAVNGKIEIRPVRLRLLLVQKNWLTDNHADDVPCPYIRPSTFGRQRSRAVSCQDQGICARPFQNATGIGKNECYCLRSTYPSSITLPEVSESAVVYIVTFASFATVVKSEYARNKDVVERAMNSHFLDTL